MRPENIEFIALFKASEWNQTEAARRLRVEPPTVSRYLSGKIRPSAAVIDLFKFILGNERPGALTATPAMQEEALAEWERRVIEDLRWLHKDDRERVVKAMKALTEGLPKRPPVEYGKVEGVSSKIASVAEGSQVSASALARHELQESQQRRGAGGPSGRKRGRGRGAGPGTKGQPGTPGQVQE